jgi:hypothetical protein
VIYPPILKNAQFEWRFLSFFLSGKTTPPLPSPSLSSALFWVSQPTPIPLQTPYHTTP